MQVTSSLPSQVAPAAALLLALSSALCVNFLCVRVIFTLLWRAPTRTLIQRLIFEPRSLLVCTCRGEMRWLPAFSVPVAFRGR